MMILIISMTGMVILMLVKGETGKGDGMLSCLWGMFFFQRNHLYVLHMIPARRCCAE